MKQYTIHEDNLPKLAEKLKRIENKCTKYDCSFSYAEVGEEYRQIQHQREVQGAYGQIGLVNTVSQLERFIIIEVEGKAIINDWQFIATLQHTENVNIIRGYSDTEIPEKYKTCKSNCEHCNSSRYRKDTYVIQNTVTNEYRQVGKSCLMDYTNGLSAEMVAQFASYFDTIAKLNNEGSNGGFTRRYIETKNVLLSANEIIKKCGFVSKSKAIESDTRIQPTSHKIHDFMFYAENEQVKEDMQKIAYNPDTEENKKEVAKMLEWLQVQKADSQYISNLQISCKNEYAEYRDIGILASLPAAYFKAIETEKQKADREAKKASRPKSEYYGNIGDKIVLNNVSFNLIASYETQFGYTRIYKILDTEGNIFIWRTAGNFEDGENISIKGTIKAHNEYNGENQTELTRCKII